MERTGRALVDVNIMQIESDLLEQRTIFICSRTKCVAFILYFREILYFAEKEINLKKKKKKKKDQE